MRYFLLILMMLQISCNKKPATEEEKACGCVSPPGPVEAQAMNISGKIQRCLGSDYPLLNSQYDKPIFNQPGLENEIFEQINTYANLNELYKQGQLSIDNENYNTCLQAIRNLSCDSSIMKNIIDEDGIFQISNIHQILQADVVCKDVYSQAPKTI